VSAAAIGEEARRFDGRVENRLVVGLMLDAQVVIGHPLALRHATVGLDLERIAEVDHRPDA
jgi:hypothetical protein